MLEVTTILKTEGFLLTVNMEKAFDSIDHLFKFHVFRKLGFGKNFIKWIKFILTNQERCIINGGKTSKYFRLKKGRRQGDPTSAYLFILVLEVVFAVTKSNKINDLKMALYDMQCINLKKESLKILGTNFLYDKKLEQEKILEVKIENALKSWKMRDLSI